MNDTRETREFFEDLKVVLMPYYCMPHVRGGHDVVHVRGVEKLGEKILPHFPEVNEMEYRIAAWLHNIDQSFPLRKTIEYSGGVESFLEDTLKTSGLSQEAVAHIIIAVTGHSKRDDNLENDPELLTALRIGDKLDRFTPLNIMACTAHRPDLPHFDPDAPFDYRHNRPCHLKYYLWVVEWYRMLPYDWARGLVDKNFFAGFLDFIRQVGQDISERLEVPNMIEDEIRAALGPHYDEWRPAKK